MPLGERRPSDASPRERIPVDATEFERMSQKEADHYERRVPCERTDGTREIVSSRLPVPQGMKRLMARV